VGRGEWRVDHINNSEQPPPDARGRFMQLQVQLLAWSWWRGLQALVVLAVATALLAVA
jgi:hypothetical protein